MAKLTQIYLANWFTTTQTFFFLSPTSRQFSLLFLFSFFFFLLPLSFSLFFLFSSSFPQAFSSFTTVDRSSLLLPSSAPTSIELHQVQWPFSRLFAQPLFTKNAVHCYPKLCHSFPFLSSANREYLRNFEATTAFMRTQLPIAANLRHLDQVTTYHAISS